MKPIFKRRAVRIGLLADERYSCQATRGLPQRGIGSGCTGENVQHISRLTKATRKGNATAQFPNKAMQLTGSERHGSCLLRCTNHATLHP